MRKYKPAFGEEVDLDDPATYDYLPKTEKELDDMMFKQIGYALVYMDYFPDRKGLFPKRRKKPEYVKMKEYYPNHPLGDQPVEINNASYNQRQRVYKLISEFAAGRRENYGNLMWLKEKIFLFQDETENMC